MTGISTLAPREHSTREHVACTGIDGLDDILAGGLTQHRLYLVEGVPGSGKTTLAMQFLMEGVRLGEQVLYVTLSESKDELESVARAHGWTLDGVAIRELAPSEQQPGSPDEYTMFHPSEMELNETTKAILEDVDRIKPSRVVFDSLSELRLLAGNALRYRRQILSLKQFFNGRRCTVMLLDDMTSADHDLQVQSIAHGVILLEQLNPDFGAERRRLRVVKFRGVAYRGGYHDYVITRGGLNVFPRLIAAEHRSPAKVQQIPSGITELDRLIGGGLECGTSTLIAGSAGTGKSTVATQFVWAAAEQGLKSAMFLFDENINTLLTRATGLGIDLKAHVETGLVSVQQVDPAELSPGELVHAVRIAAREGASIIVIDSLNGYLNAMPGERHLVIQLHELLTYLGQSGVATLLISAHHGLIGSNMVAPVDATYLADTVIIMRYFEALGEVRQAISVMKKRGSSHERTIREFRMQSGRISVGEPLRQFQGVLNGVPVIDPQSTNRHKPRP